MRYRVCLPAPEGLEPFRLRKGNAFGEKAAFFRKEKATFSVSVLQWRCDALFLLRRCRSVGGIIKAFPIAPVSVSGADAETHSKAFPNGTASND